MIITGYFPVNHLVNANYAGNYPPKADVELLRYLVEEKLGD